MKAARISFWIASLSLAAVLMVGLVDVQRTSPGPVTSVHAQVEALGQGTSCSQRQGGWLSNMTDACLECHARIEEQIEERSGLHGAQPKSIARRCSTCHSEHHGSGFAIVNGQSFALAGAVSRAAFDHRMFGWETDGAHVELDCVKRHANADVAVLPVGEVRFLGLRQDCASCHDDPRDGKMVLSCVSCHGQQAWDGLHAQDHDKRMPLIGGHGDVTCRACHEKDTPGSLEALVEAVRRPKPRECVECHESPHSEPFARSAALEARASVGAGCVSCHAAEHESFRDERLALTPRQHAASGFALWAPQAELECAQRHAPEAPDFRAHHPGRGQDQCSACHDDPHAGQFASGPFATGDCLACHSRQHFEPHEFDLDEHARAALKLTGAHATAQCSACHSDPPAGHARTFRGAPSQCSECHDDAHDDHFAARLASSPPAPSNGDCARCHDAERFSNAEAGFDHARWTGFAVHGAHAQTRCESCHPRSQSPDPSGRTFGRVREHFGVYESCHTCQSDLHASQFHVQGQADCARCHTPTTESMLDFDHDLDSRFPLGDAHRKLDCSACHHEEQQSGLEFVRYRPLGTRCVDCHGVGEDVLLRRKPRGK